MQPHTSQLVSNHMSILEVGLWCQKRDWPWQSRHSRYAYIERGAAMHGAGAWAAMHCGTTFDPVRPSNGHFASSTEF